MSALGAFLILLALAAAVGLVWLFSIAPLTTAIMLAVVVSLVIASAMRTVRRPSPFGACVPIKSTCLHCGHVIHDDDAVRTVPTQFQNVSAIMHERCARERQAVES